MAMKESHKTEKSIVDGFLQQQVSELEKNVTSLTAKNKELTEANADLQKEVERVSKENDILYKRVGRGDYDVTTMKVV